MRRQADLNTLHLGIIFALDERYAQLYTSTFVCILFSTGIPLLATGIPILASTFVVAPPLPLFVPLLVSSQLVLKVKENILFLKYSLVRKRKKNTA